MKNWQIWSWERAKSFAISFSFSFSHSSLQALPETSCSSDKSFDHSPSRSTGTHTYCTVASTVGAMTILRQSWPPKHSKETYFPRITIIICIFSFFFYRPSKSQTSRWLLYRLEVAREALGDTDGVVGVAVPVTPEDVAMAVEELEDVETINY